MQKKTFTIGEIAKILDVPASTLRFWEEKGLFHISKGENSYRVYTTTDLIQIADIIFYRNLGIPIRQVSDFLSVSLENYEQYLLEIQQQLTNTIHEYEHMYQRTYRQQERYQTLLRLLKKPFSLEEVPFSHLVAWDFWEKEKLNCYIDNPARYVWYRDTSANIPGQKGLIQTEPPEESPQLLWRRTEGARFVTFPIRAMIDEGYEGLEAEEIVEKLQQHYHTGIFLAQHLLTCKENGCNVEYLKGYLELREPVCSLADS